MCSSLSGRDPERNALSINTLVKLRITMLKIDPRRLRRRKSKHLVNLTSLVL